MPQMDEVMHAPNICARKRETEREREEEKDDAMQWKWYNSHDSDKIAWLLVGQSFGCTRRGSQAHQADATLYWSGARPRIKQPGPGMTREKKQVGKGYIKNQVSYGNEKSFFIRQARHRMRAGGAEEVKLNGSL